MRSTGVNARVGLAPPAGKPYIFIFTGDVGADHGYEDRFQPDGTFWYTGEGQVGDRRMDRGNLGHHTEHRTDSEGNWRDTFVFELEAGSSSVAGGQSATTATDVVAFLKKEPKYWTMSSSSLRQLAEHIPPATTDLVVRRQVIRQRSDAVRVYVLRRANGFCEGCGAPAPFKRTNQRPYRDPHHIHRIADDGPDHTQHVIALCPNCHRRVHYGQDGDEFNRSLAEKMKLLEDKSSVQ